MLRLSDKQQSMLLAAAQRDVRFLLPAANTPRPALKAFADKLIEAGWAKKIKTTDGTLAWGKNAGSGEAFALRLTAKGVKAAMVSSAPDQVVEPVVRAAKNRTTAAPSSRSITPAEGHPEQASNSGLELSASAARAPRASSKLGRVLEMLSTDAGATIGELVTATGWLEHTTRAALTGLRRRGYALALAKKERNGASVYRIIANASGSAK